MKKLSVFVLLGGLVLPSISHAIDLKQSKFTQVINNVEVISTADKTRHAVAVNDIFKMPDVLRTGPNSRVEMVAEDNTITRVGANTIFSFDPANRTMDLQQGSVLFHSPHGKGGGTIRTGSATASVIGTTIIVTTTPNGGFKILDLEGQAEIRYLNGLNEKITPGQMVFILPGGGTSPIIVFRLDAQTKDSYLVNGFNSPLPSWPNIASEITRQLLMLLNGKVTDPDLIVGDNATPDSVQVRMDLGGNQLADSSIIGSDHTPNQPLPINYSPLDAGHVKSSPFTPPGNFSEQLTFLGITTPASGFLARNIDIDTAEIDLSDFSGKSDFDIIATGDMKIWQSVDFTTSSETAVLEETELPDTISLIAKGQMAIASGVTLEADTGTFGLVAGSFAVLDTDDGSIAEDHTLQNVEIDNYSGDVDVLSQSDLTMDDYSSIYANGSIDLESDGSLSLGSNDSVTRLAGYDYDVEIDAGETATVSAVGDLNLYDTQVYAGYDGDSFTTIFDVNLNSFLGDISVDYSDLESGGSIYLTAFDGSVFVTDDTYIEACDGGVGITAVSGDVDVSSTEIYADSGNVELDAGGNVNIEDETTISASADVNITGGDTFETDTIGTSSDNINVDIAGSYIYAGDNGEEGSPSFGGGNVNITANNGDILICDSEIYAYAGSGSEADGGCVNIEANGTGNVDIKYDSDIEADRDVNISSGGEFLLGGESTSSGFGDIDISGSEIYAGEEGSFGGSVNITAGGNVTICDSEIYAYSGEFSDGEINVTANGSIDVLYSDLSADDVVTLNAGDYVNVFDSYESSDLCISDWNITAGTYVDIGADGNVGIYDSQILAEDGDVNITSEGSDFISGDFTSTGGDITISCDTFIEAADSIYVTANDGSISIRGGSTLQADDGDIDINAYNGGIKVKDGSVLTANGSVYLEADCNIDICDSIISATSSDTLSGESSGSGDQISISSDDGRLKIIGQNGEGYIGDSQPGYDLGADSKICLFGEDGVSISDAVIETLDGSSCDRIKITSDGTICIDDSQVYSDGSVKIISYGDDIDIKDGSEIDAFGGDLTIGSACQTEDVTLCDASVYSDDSVNISASGDIGIYNSSVNASGDVDVEAGGMLTVDAGREFETITGDLVEFDIDAGDSVYLEGDCVKIKNTAIYASGEVDITSDDGSVRIKDSDIETGSGGVYLTAYYGDLTLDSGCEDYGVTITAAGEVNMQADGDINVYDSEIIANNSGDVTASAGGSIDIEGGSNFGSISGNNVTLDAGHSVTLSGETITANGAVTINSGNDSEEEFSLSHSHHAGNHFAPVDVGGVSFSGGDSTILPATIDAGDIDIENQSSEANSLGITTDDGTVYIAGSTLTADNGEVDISGSGDVSIFDSTIEASADGTESTGNVNITSTDGGITLGTLDDDTISASGSINLNAVNDINVSSTTFNADGDLDATSSDGSIIVANSTINTANVNLHANQNIDIEYTEGSVDGSVYATADYGYVTVHDTDLSLNNWDISAGEYVDLSADDSVQIQSTFIGASGDVDITATGTEGSISLLQTEIEAGGDISMESTGTLSLGGDVTSAYTIDAGGEVDMTSDSSDVTSSYYDIYADNGGVYVTADNGSIDLENSQIEGDEDVQLEAADTITLNSSQVFSDFGNIDISASSPSPSKALFVISTQVDIENSLVEAYNGGVTIDAFGDIILCNNTDGNGIFADDGTVDISTAIGNIGIYNTSIASTYGDVDINAGSFGPLEIPSFGDVDIFCSDISADEGNVSIGAGESVDIEYSTIEASSDSDIRISNGTSITGTSIDINAEGGTISIFAGQDLTINNSTLDFGGNISVCGSTLEATAGDVDIISTGGLEINVNDSVSISGSTISGGGIDISGSTITADNGNVNISSLNPTSTPEVSAEFSLNDISISDSAISANAVVEDGLAEPTSGFVSITADGNVDVLDSAISADNGVTVSGGGYVNIFDVSCLFASDSFISDWNVTAGTFVDIAADQDVTVSDSDIIANGGDVDITSGSSISLSGSSTVTENVTVENSEIEASDAVNVLANDGSVSILDGAILTADDGNVNVTADSGAISIQNSTLTAAGSVNLVADSDITVNDTVITAKEFETAGNILSSSDAVSISSGGELTINGQLGTTVFDIGADHEIDLSGTGGVTINDATIKILNGDSGDLISVSSDDAIGLNGSDLESGGKVKIVSNDAGEVDVNETTINAGGDVCISSEGTITPSLLGVDLTGGDVTIENVSDIESGGTIHVTSNTGEANVMSSTISAANDVDVTAANGITVDGSTIKANADTGTINLTSTSGQTVIENGATLQSFYITVNSGDGILIDGSGGGGLSLSGNTLSLSTGLGDVSDDTSGGHTVTVQDTDLGQFATVNVQGHTVNLDSVNFSSSSSYNFTSFYGGYHINDGHTAGYVNFNNDTLDNATSIINTGSAGAANQSNNGGIVLGGSGTGIHINGAP